MNRARPALVAPQRGDMLIEMTRNTLGSFDAEAFHVMQQRDDQLVEEEILYGAQSSAFVYKFEIAGKQVSGVSVVGARHLAAAYGGLRHRLVSSVLKIGALHTYTSYAGENQPMMVNAGRLPELADEDDFYSCVVEIMDIKIGNTIQMEARESRFERRRDGSLFERPHFQKICQSKAYRNAILNLIPQDVRIRWQTEMLKLGKEQVITDSVIDQKRAGILTYCATAGIPVDRDRIDSLTMAQITGLAEAARSKDRVRVEQALAGLGLTQEKIDDETGEITTPSTTPPAKTRRSRTATPSTGPEPPPADEGGEPTGITDPTGAAPDSGPKPRRPMFSRQGDL